MSVTKLKVRLYGDPCLRTPAEPVDEIGPSERMLIQAMVQTMYHYKGIGLAAPQVGISKRIFVADIGDGPVAFVNPRIINVAGSKVIEEGCLSIPNINIDVKRAEKVTVQYFDENGDEYEGTFDEMMARVILHEYDHLDGKMIVDYADEQTLESISNKLKELEDLNK